MTNAQFQAAFALALSHGHYWAVKAHPKAWEAARIAASYPRWRDGKASTRVRADEAAALAASESRANEYGESAAVAAARSASDAVWAGYDAAQCALAAVKAADENYTDVIGPEGPEDYEAALVIARTRDEQGWCPRDLAPRRLGELEARAAEAALPSSGYYPVEYWERHTAPVRDALAVLAAAGQGREAQAKVTNAEAALEAAKREVFEAAEVLRELRGQPSQRWVPPPRQGLLRASTPAHLTETPRNPSGCGRYRPY